MMPTTSEDSPVTTEDFETSQTVCAAYLVYQGHEVVRAVWENRTCTFFFEQTEELAQDFGDFIRNKALVEPVAFSNAFGQCSAMVRDLRPDDFDPRRKH